MSIKTLDILGTRFEIDEEKTATLNEPSGFGRDWCQCDGCTNARMGRMDSFPPQQLELLRAMGLDPKVPYHSAWTRQRSPSARHHTQRFCCWPIYGEIVGPEPNPRLYFDRHNWMSANSDREPLDDLIENFKDLLTDVQGIVWVVTCNRLIWIFGELCSSRTIQTQRGCPRCRSTWRLVGYLRKSSIIPAWKNLPALGEALRSNDTRVYAEFCTLCGRMEAEIVPNKPPFLPRTPSIHARKRVRRSPGYPWH